MIASLYQSGFAPSGAGRRGGVIGGVSCRRPHAVVGGQRSRSRRATASGQRAGRDAERPVTLGGARAVHARLADPGPADPAPARSRRWRPTPARRGSYPSGCRARPRRRVFVPEVAEHGLPFDLRLFGAARPAARVVEPADRRVVVVRAGVDDGIARVVVRQEVGALGSAPNANWRIFMPGSPKLVAQRAPRRA